MKRWAIIVTVTAAIGALGLFGKAATAQNSSAEDPAANSSAPHEINITGDSAPGWVPTTIQEEQALKRANDFFSALDEERYPQAYAMLVEVNRQLQPLAQFIHENHDFHEQSGPVIQRNILKVTWTKDPAAAPFPGVYAAIDIATRFVNVDRHCGYVVLYQRPSGGDFEVMREESNYIDNATAEKIERQQSRATLDSIWAALATYCPNYVVIGSPGSAL